MNRFRIALLPFVFARTPIGILLAITLFALACATSVGQDNDKEWSAKIASMKENRDAAVADGKMTEKQANDEMVVVNSYIRMNHEGKAAVDEGKATQEQVSKELNQLRKRFPAIIDELLANHDPETSDRSTEPSNPLENPTNFALSVAEKSGNHWRELAQIASALTRAGKFDRAIEVAKMIKPLSGSNGQEAALGGIADALVDSEEFNRAVKVALLNQGDSNKIDALNKIALAMVKVGEREHAISALGQSYNLAKELEEGSTKANALHKIGLASIEAGNKRAAAIILKKAAGLAQNMGDDWMKPILLRDLALALAETGEIENALILAQKIKDGSSKADALLTIASTMVETGDKVGAVKTLNQSFEVALDISDQAIKPSVLHRISLVFAKAGESKRAAEVARKIEDAGFRRMALDSIESVDDKSEELAMQQIQEMMRRTAKARAKQTAGMMKMAMEAATENQDAFSKASTLLMLASFQLESGDKKEATTSINNAVEVAQRIDNPVKKASLFGEISSEFTEIGDQQQSIANLVRAVDAASNIENSFRQQSTLLSFALQLATEPLDETKEERETRKRESGSLSRGGARRLMKSTFTPDEQQLAGKISNSIQAVVKAKKSENESLENIDARVVMVMADKNDGHETEPKLEKIAERVKEKTEKEIQQLELKIREQLVVELGKHKALRANPELRKAKDFLKELSDVSKALHENQKRQRSLKKGKEFVYGRLALPMKLGDFGQLAFDGLKAGKVIDSNTMMAHWNSKNVETALFTQEVVMIRGVSTKRIREGEQISFDRQLFYVAETTKHDTATGGAKTVFVLSALDSAKIDEHLKN